MHSTLLSMVLLLALAPMMAGATDFVGDGTIPPPQTVGGGANSSPVFVGGGANSKPVFVGGGASNQSVGLENPLGTTDLMTLLNRILEFVIRIGSIVVVFMLVYVGYLFATGSVNPKQIEDAKKYLLYTIIGALILLGSKAIALGIEATVKALSVGR